MEHSLVTLILNFYSTGDGGKTLKSFYVSKFLRVSGNQVREFCRNESKDSLSIETQDEFEALKKALSSQNYKYITENLLFGAQVNEGSNHMEWHWESSGKTINFPLRFTGKNPDNIGGDENCLEIVFEEGQFGFNDLSCSTYRKFLCESIESQD